MAFKDDYHDFKVALNDLKMNSKPLINTLTKLAEERISSAGRIVRALEERIFEASPDHILPALYTLDSIVKNLRSSIYVELFESRLPTLFSYAFSKVDDSTKSSMFKLRQTWPSFFKNLTLYNVDTRIHDIDEGWPILARVPDLVPSNCANEERKISIVFLPSGNDDSSTFRTRTVSLPPVSIAPPKTTDLTTHTDVYKAIPENRMEQIRQETAFVLDLGVDGQQQSKIRKLSEKKKKSNKKRRPSGRLRRRIQTLAQAIQQNRSVSSSEESADEKAVKDGDGGDNDDDDDDDDEPIIIKKYGVIVNQPLSNQKENEEQNPEIFFGGKDKDYRESDLKKNEETHLDAEILFEINSKCLSLAEKKFKAKEFSADEYQAASKLFQSILESEVKRLSNQQNFHDSSPITDGMNLLNQSTPFSNPATNNLPFQQEILSFIEQHAGQTRPSNHLNSLLNSTFPHGDLASETYRNVMQILSSVGAPASYTSHYNFLSYFGPMTSPTATGTTNSLSLFNRTFSPNSLSSPIDANLFSFQQSPPLKRILEENENQSNGNHVHIDEEVKRPRFDPVTGRAIRTRESDDEKIALVPSLIDANINMLKKNYFGIAQQLYVGKFQCRTCGLRFTMKQRQDYTHHLDWHYLENRREKELRNGTISSLTRRTRQWFPSIFEWTIYEDLPSEINSTTKPQQTPIENKVETNELFRNGENNLSENGVVSCPASSNGGIDDDYCFVCHDPFENFFDDNREEWRLKNAMSVDGKTFHPICYEDLHGS